MLMLRYLMPALFKQQLRLLLPSRTLLINGRVNDIEKLAGYVRSYHQPMRFVCSKTYDSPRDMPLEARKVEHIKELIKDGKLAEIDHIFQATPTDINARDKDRRTFLMHAAENNQLEIVQFLLNRGAKITLMDDHGDTAFTLAAKSNSEKVESLLGKTLLDQRATVAQNDNQYGPVTS